MKLFGKLFLCTFFIFTAAAAFCAAVNIYHTNDAHAFYYPRLIDGRLTGGYAALAGFLKQQKKPYLLFDGGDFLAGTYEAKETKGLLSVQLMDMLGYNAAVIGNHEGDFGEDAFFKFIDEAKFDILAANIRDAQTGLPLPKILPYKMYEISGKKIAVIGLARDPLPSSKKIKTGRDITSLRKAVAEVKKYQPDAVIVLTHSSAYEGADKKELAYAASVARVKGIDLALGGHIHRVVSRKINNTVFVESGGELGGLSKIILDFDDKTGKLNDIKTEYIFLDASKYTQDEKVKQYAEKFYNKEIDRPIGTAKERIFKRNQGKDIDSPLGNLFADIIRQSTGADIALQNTEGIRMDIAKGDITKRAVFDVFPFSNKVVLVKVSGDFIKTLATRALRDSYSSFQYSGLGLKYTVKDNKPVITEMLVNGQPLEGPKIYTLAVNDFNASGRAEGHMFKNLPGKTSFGDITIRDMFLDYLKANPKGIAAPPTGRVKKI